MADKKKYYANLTKLLAAGFFICGIIPILIVATTSIFNFKQVALNDIEITASQMVQNRQDVINKFLEHQMDLVATLINLYPLEYLQNQEHLDHLFLAISKSGGIIDLQIISTNGDQLAYVGPYREQVVGKNYKDQDWFKEVLVRGTHVSDVFSGYRKIPHFVVALTDPLKRYVLRTTINSSIFNSLLHSAQIGSHGDVVIVNKNGDLQTPSLQKIESINSLEKQLIRPHSGPEVTIEKDFMYATTWVNNNNWMLIVKVQINDMLGTYENHINNTRLIILITATLFLIIAIMLSRFIVAHITKADLESAALDQQMAHIEKMANIGRLAAGVAHEINNPLQMILAQAGWIEELLPEEDPAAIKNLDEYTATVKKIKHHVERAATITHRLLGFARKISPEQQSVQINEVIQETLSFFERESKNNNITVNLQLNPDLPTTITEGHRLQQVLLNLIDNALDAVGHDGKVDITTTNDAEDIFIQVADNGSGIPPEVLGKIWDPFFTTKEQGKGTGLGLSISQNIIQSLGGTITVQNRYQGGTLFTVKMPIRHSTQDI